MKKHRYKNMHEFAAGIGLPAARGLEAEVKAKLTAALIKEIERSNLTHLQVANAADVSRSTITGIVNGSLSKVTIDRLLKILGAIGLGVDMKVKKAG